MTLTAHLAEQLDWHWHWQQQLRPRLDLALHINREVIHHGAEIALLRDLYNHREN